MQEKKEKTIGTIPYDREELWEIIEEIPLSTKLLEQFSLDLDNIEEQISIIHQYSAGDSKDNVTQAVIRIRQVAESLYTHSRKYDPILAYSLRKVILQWIEPIEAALAQQVIMAQKTKRLYAEQSYIERNRVPHEQLTKHLNQIARLFKELGKANPSCCYIVYAPPSDSNKSQEFWIEPFLSVLCDHLQEAGIHPIMDIKHLKLGERLELFMNQYRDGSPIVLIGTESLNYYHKSLGYTSTQTALAIVRRQFESNPHLIYPLLISGCAETAFPNVFHFDSSLAHGIEGYLTTLRHLVDWLLQNRIAHKKEQYEQLWEKFCDNQQQLPEYLIDDEIALGYHKLVLEHLSKDIIFQIKKAQDKPYNDEVFDKIITVLKENAGPIEAVFDETGKQFQRPNRDPNFIKRPALANELSRHFKQKDQTMLVLASLRGMGKTTLAADYYLNPRQPYPFRAWFKVGNNSESLESQYIRLALEHGVSLPASGSQEQKVHFVKDWLEQQENCLLIYDDVAEPELLEPFLPEVKSQQIIITTTNQSDWFHDKRFCLLEVPSMEEQEALALVYKITGFSTESENAVKQLAQTVQYIPLVLAQTSAYMARSHCNVSDYLDTYRKYQAILLTEIGALSPRHAPIWLTFDNEFEALKHACPEAWLLLKQVSWLASELIPEEVLKTMLGCSDSRWPVVKEEIMRYSFMQHHSTGLRMTALLQDILRSRQSQEESKEILETLCTLFKNQCATHSSEGPLISHLNQLKQHAPSLFPKQTTLTPPNPRHQNPLFNLTLFSQGSTQLLAPKQTPAKAPEEELYYLCWSAEDMHRIKQLLAIPGININKQFFLGNTCLITAAEEGHKELVHLLLQNGADKSIEDFTGETAADAASSPEIKELINAWEDSTNSPIASLNL